MWLVAQLPVFSFFSFIIIIIIIIICLCLCVPCVRSHNKYITEKYCELGTVPVYCFVGCVLNRLWLNTKLAVLVHTYFSLYFFV